MKCKVNKLSIIAALSYAVSCTPQEMNVSPAEVTQKSIQMEVAYPGQMGLWKRGFWHNSEVFYHALNGEAVIDGDIVIHPSDLSEEQLPRVETAGRTRTSSRWPNRTIIYNIDASVPNRALVEQAIAHWQTLTPIRFAQRTSERAYVLFRGGSGCSANVGRVGVEQYINIGPECGLGNIIHEIGHAVGLWHEHSRADRDQHVTVNYGNIASGQQNNFQTYGQMGFDGFDMGPTLDFGSIMMYGSYTLSANGQPTITRKDGSVFNVQRDGLSPQDIETVRQMYP